MLALGFEHRFQYAVTDTVRTALPHDPILESDSRVVFGERFHPRRFVQLRARRLEPPDGLIGNRWPFDVVDEPLKKDRFRARRVRARPGKALHPEACQARRGEESGLGGPHAADYAATYVPCR